MRDQTAAELIKNDKETLKYMKTIAEANKPKQVIIRGLLMGVFTALGTTLGIAIVILLLTQSITGLRQIPFIDDFFEETQLDLLIESQLARVNQEIITGEEVPEATDSEPDITELSYSDTEFGFSFNYPSTLDTFKEITDEQGTSKQVRFSGSGTLQTFDIYINEDLVVYGSDSTQRFVAREDIDRITISIFENGATVTDLAITNPLFHTNFTAGGNTFTIVGIGDPELPKLSREIFISIIESLEFTSL